MTVNSQVVIMFSVVQEQWHTTACLSKRIQTWFRYWILCILVFRQMSRKCMYCIDTESPGLFWCLVSAFRLLTFPVWTNCRCLQISWVNIKVIWKLSQWRQPFLNVSRATEQHLCAFYLCFLVERWNHMVRYCDWCLNQCIQLYLCSRSLHWVLE